MVTNQYGGESYITSPEQLAAFKEKQQKAQDAAQARQKDQQQKLQARIEAIKQILKNPDQADQESYQAGYRVGERFILKNSHMAWVGDTMFIAALQRVGFHSYFNRQQQDSWCAGFVKAMRDNY
jgi:hypothetical protein